MAEDEAIEHQRQHQAIAEHAEPEQAVGQRRKLAAREGDVSNDDPHRRHEPARNHVVDFKLFGPMPDESGQERQVQQHGKQPEPLAQTGVEHADRLGNHHGAHGIGGHHAADHGVSQILPQQARVQQKLEGQDHQQHGGNGCPQQLQATIEVTGIFPAPTETGDPERQPCHGSRGFA